MSVLKCWDVPHARLVEQNCFEYIAILVLSILDPSSFLDFRAKVSMSMARNARPEP